MSKKSHRLRFLFCKELEKWAKNKKQQHRDLTMELVNWACQPVSTGDRKFWSMVEDQIRFNAEKMGISPKKVIAHLFDQENSEEWMSKFKQVKK